MITLLILFFFIKTDLSLDFLVLEEFNPFPPLFSSIDSVSAKYNYLMLWNSKLKIFAAMTFSQLKDSHDFFFVLVWH